MLQNIFNKTNIYQLSEFFDKINKIEISEQDSTNLISYLTQILERYVYLDIARNPPQPPDNDEYHNRVNLIKMLNEINTHKQSLYDFYREVKLVICSCQDLHLSITLNKEFEKGLSLGNSLFVSPYILSIEKGKVYANPFNEEYFEQTEEDKNIIKFIEDNNVNPIESINGIDPLVYIRQFNKGFNILKSRQAQFVLNQRIIPMMPISGFPFDIEDLKDINIKYENEGGEINTYYKVIHNNDDTKAFLSKYFILPKNNEPFNLNMPKLKEYFFRPQKKSNRKLEEIKWDKEIEEGQLKCRVDNQNKVNVIYQSSFMLSEAEKAYQFFIDCFNSFYKNNYKIVVIEQFNGGGYVIFADIFKEFLNLHQPAIDYMSYRYNDDVKNYVAKNNYMKEIETCERKQSDNIFDEKNVEDDYGVDTDGIKIKHNRTKIFDLSFVPEDDFIKIKKKKNIRKPHEIIIFTDGFSYSATSIFIKGIQLDGGAIIVGYAGDPDENEFDSSQSPTPVFSTEGAKDGLSKNIEKLNFTLGYPMMEMFNRLDDENDTEINYPLEYQINPIDERAQIFNSYDDSNYQEFIDEALKIFDKYEKKCNPNNKNLLFITKDCKFEDKNMHGGYQCNDDGTWSKICVPSYCDNGYYFDRINKECKKNVCITKSLSDDDKNKAFLIVFIIFGVLFLIFLIIYIIAIIIGGFERKNYLLIPISIFLIIFAVFIILYFKS